MRKKLIYGFLALALVFGLAGAVSAQTENTTEDSAAAEGADDVAVVSTNDAVGEPVAETGGAAAAEEAVLEEALDSDELASVDEELEGIEVTEPQTAPSNFGLFWRGIKEGVALTFTFDPVKKAERRIKYAEERQLIAEKILTDSTDPKAQERAQKVLDKATEMIARVEEKKEQFLANIDEKKERLLKNMAAHEVRREQVFDRIEQKFQERLEQNPDLEDKYQKFQELREGALQRGKGLLNAMDNVPPQIKERLQRVKERIDQKADEHKEFIQERRELLKDAAAGDEEAKDKLKELNQERKEAVKENIEKREEVRERVQEKKIELREAAEAGDEDAAKKLRAVNQTQKIILDKVENIKDRREDVRDRAEDALDAREDKADKREDIRDKREDVRDAKYDGGIKDKIEDALDKKEDILDRREDAKDVKENIIDRRENIKDRIEDVRDARKKVLPIVQ